MTPGPASGGPGGAGRIEQAGTFVVVRERLHTSCAHPQAGFRDGEAEECGQAEVIRVPLTDGTLVELRVAADSALIPFLPTLSDVFGTGHHAAVAGGDNERTRVTVIGDGAVGLLAVLSAKRLGAQQITLMGRHQARIHLGRESGATDVVSARGEEGIEAVRELTGGHGTHVVLEAVGRLPAREQALAVSSARPSRRPGVSTGVLGIGSGSVHVTPDPFDQALPCLPRPALGQPAGGVLDPQQRPLDSGPPSGVRAVVPVFRVGPEWLRSLRTAAFVRRLGRQPVILMLVDVHEEQQQVHGAVRRL